MKKISLLTIIFILFALSNNSIAKKPPKKFLDENFIFKPEQNIKYPYKTGLWGQLETHNRIHQNPWALRYSNEITNTNEYSLRFEKRLGDCGSDDCDRKEKKFIGRSELMFFNPREDQNIKGQLGEYWYSWSFFIDPSSQMPSKKSFIHMGQFKMSLEHEKLTRNLLTSEKIDEFNVICPEMNLYFSLREDGIYVERSGVLKCGGHDNKIIINKKDVIGKWHNVLLNVNWTDQEDGKIKLWLNEKLIYQKLGKSISKIVRNKKNKKMGPEFRFGIYSQGENGDQVFYYDNMKAFGSCESFKTFDCDNLLKQKLISNNDNTQIVGQFENNDDPEKRKRIVNTLIKKISKKIITKTNANLSDVFQWVEAEVEKLDWDTQLNKGSDRNKIKDKIINKGIKKFN